MAIIQLLQRSARSILCLGVLGTSTAALAAVALPQITQPIDNQNRTTLHGNVRPMPRRARDLGAVDSNIPASRVLLLLKRPAEQETALQQYIAAAHTPGSPSYHRWLTPAQIGSQFGPAESDVQAVIAWLQSQGFVVGKVSAARTTIEFSGTAGQIESAFATRIHSFQLDGVHHVSNVTDPRIPAALAPVIAGISPLNDFHPRAAHTAPAARSLLMSPTSANPRAMTSVPRKTQSGSTIPSYTDTSNGLYSVTPADFATIYDTPNSALNKNFSGGTSLNGAGVSIGIAGDSNIDGLASGSNVANYRSLFGLPPVPAGSKVIVDGNDPGTGGGDEFEALLDLEVASAVAPGANLLFYTAQDTTFQNGLNLAIQRALDDNQVSILNVSFGGCEAYQGQSGNQEFFNFWEQAAAQGISVTVSTGDSGSAGCDNPNTETSAVQGLEVNGLGSTPFNIAVGGTDFNQDQNNIAQYWSATNSSIAGSALKYIPEIPWNDSTTTIGSFSANVPFKDNQNQTNISGAGGGVSSCLDASVDPATGDILSCTGNGYPKPSWQSSFGTTPSREVPDISLFASNGFRGSAWFVCASGIGGDQPGQKDCDTPPSGSIANGTYTDYQVVGGTSASSPAFAGVLALITQHVGGARIGQANYTLYPLSKQHPEAFHDVTTGNNSVVCDPTNSNVLDCFQNGFVNGYDAATGFDDASGLGSLDVTKLIQNWSAVTFKSTTTALTVNGSANPVSGIVHGTPVNVAVSVTSSGGTPTGDVALVASTTPGANAVQGTTPSPSVLTLSNGNASNTSYSYLPGGSYSLTANYGGDGTFASSISNAISVTISPEPSTLDLLIQDFDASTGKGAAVTSVPYGTYISVAAQPLSTAQVNSTQKQTYTQQATGTVTFSGSPAPFNVTDVVNVNSNGFAEFPNQLSIAYAPGTYTVNAAYSGDASFAASTAAPQTFTVTKNNVSISVPSSTATTAVIQVDPASINGNFFSSGFKLPTGTVTLTNTSGGTVGTGTLSLGADAQGNQVAQASVALSGAAANISYSGDVNYNTGTAAFTGGGGTSSFSLSSTPTTVTIKKGNSATTSISITPSSFTGTVSLSCAVTGGTTSQPTCALALASVSVSGSTAVTDTLTINTTASSAARRVADNSNSSTWYAAGGAALAGILLFGIPGRRRAWQRLLGLMLLFISVGVIGCGGGSGGGGGGGGTPAGTYTVTVTATSGSKTATTTVTATVQ